MMAETWDRWMPQREWGKAMDALGKLSPRRRAMYEPSFIAESSKFAGLICKDEGCRRGPEEEHWEGCQYRD